MSITLIVIRSFQRQMRNDKRKKTVGRYEDKQDSYMDRRKRKDDTSLKKVRITNPQSSIKGEEALLGRYRKTYPIFVSIFCNDFLNFL